MGKQHVLRAQPSPTVCSAGRGAGSGHQHAADVAPYAKQDRAAGSQWPPAYSATHRDRTQASHKGLPCWYE